MLTPGIVLTKQRNDEALNVVLKLHAHKSPEDSPAVQFAKEEFYQMKTQVERDEATSQGETLGALFTRPSYRKRMFCGFLVMFGSQSTGILVVYSE